jgi:hypothetical protein
MKLVAEVIQIRLSSGLVVVVGHRMALK